MNLKTVAVVKRRRRTGGGVWKIFYTCVCVYCIYLLVVNERSIYIKRESAGPRHIEMGREWLLAELIGLYTKGNGWLVSAAVVVVLCIYTIRYWRVDCAIPAREREARAQITTRSWKRGADKRESISISHWEYREEEGGESWLTINNSCLQQPPQQNGKKIKKKK